jgi:nitrate/nitrite transporter NarK
MKIFDTAMGTMSGIIGAIGGFGCLGMILAIGIPMMCCVIPMILGMNS